MALVFPVESLRDINAILTDLLCKRKQREYYCFSYTCLSRVETNHEGNDEELDSTTVEFINDSWRGGRRHCARLKDRYFCSSALTCFYFNENKTKKRHSIIYTNEQLNEKGKSNLSKDLCVKRKQEKQKKNDAISNRYLQKSSLLSVTCIYAWVNVCM